jgi:hypothetical protein
LYWTLTQPLPLLPQQPLSVPLQLFVSSSPYQRQRPCEPVALLHWIVQASLDSD